jgi:hypothetical protein
MSRPSGRTYLDWAIELGNAVFCLIPVSVTSLLLRVDTRRKSDMLANFVFLPLGQITVDMGLKRSVLQRSWLIFGWTFALRTG